MVNKTLISDFLLEKGAGANELKKTRSGGMTANCPSPLVCAGIHYVAGRTLGHF